MNKYLIDILNDKGEVFVAGLGLVTKKTYSTGLNHVKLDASATEGAIDLAAYVAEKEGVSEQDANNKIAKYVQEIEAELATGNTYEIFGLGRFSKTDAGNIYFITVNDSHRSTFQDEEKEESASTDSKPEEKTDSTLVKEEKSTPEVKKEEEETKETPKESDDKEESEEATDDDKEERPKVRLKSNVPRKTDETEDKEEQEEVKKSAEIDTPEEKKEEVKVEKTSTAEPVEEEKKEEQPGKEEKEKVQETTSGTPTPEPVKKESEAGKEEEKSEIIDNTDKFGDNEPDLVNKHLQEILKVRDFVIITSFGKISGETASSGLLKFTFDTSVKNGDETLAAYLVVKNKMKEDKARVILSNYIANIEATIEKGGEFTIPGIGKFVKGESGGKEFVTSSAPIWKSEEAVSTPKKETKVEKKEDNEAGTARSTDKTVATSTTNTSESASNVEKTDKTVSSKEDKPSNQDQKKGKDQKGGKTREKKKPEGKKKKKKGFPWVLVIILVVILGGGGAAGFFFMEDIKNMLGAGEPVAQNDEQMDDSWSDSTDTGDADGMDENAVNESEGMENENETSEEAGMDDSMSDSDSDGLADNSDNESASEDNAEMPEEEPVVESKPDPVTTSNYSGAEQFHIIGNVFDNASNADEYIMLMKGKGYEAQNLGLINGHNFVAIKSYSTKQAALDDLNSVTADAPGAWVFKWPK